jgi:translocation protein SEC63
MIEIACMREWFWTAQAMIEFRVQLVQALDVKSSPLIQIPHFNDEAVKKFQRGKNAVTTLKQFLDQPPDERKGLADLKPEQLLDVDAFCKHVSMADIKTTVEVEDEEEMVVGDIATVTVGLHRVNLQEGEAIGPVHAPFFPEPKFEEWWIFLCEAGPGTRIMTFEKVRDWEKQIEVKMRFQISRPGKHQMVVHALCDSYAGLDLKSDINFVAKTENEVNREIILHKEDEELELVPTLFQQMMGEIGNKDDDSEEEEEEGPKSKPAKKDAPKEDKKKKEEDDDSSSSSSSSSSSDED